MDNYKKPWVAAKKDINSELNKYHPVYPMLYGILMGSAGTGVAMMLYLWVR